MILIRIEDSKIILIDIEEYIWHADDKMGLKNAVNLYSLVYKHHDNEENGPWIKHMKIALA